MRFTIEDSPVPKYVQLRDQILLAIESGRLSVGDQLPTEDALVRELGISRNTVRQAMADLLQRGQVTRERGRGTFVALQRTRHLDSESPTSRAIGVLVRDIASQDDVYPEIIRGIQDVCSQQDYHVILANTDARLDRMAEGMKSFLKAGVSGTIISPAMDQMAMTTSQLRQSFKESLELYNRFLDSGIPIVLINRRVPNLPVPCVLSDNELGGYLATKHLLDQGHRRIAALFPPVYSTVKARETGYRKALAEAGIAPAEGWVQFACLDDPDPVRTMVDAVTKLSSPPTAIFAFTDDYAAKIFERLMELGLRVPEDVALVGYNDCRLALSLPVPLTSVAYPKYEIGQKAAQMLLRHPRPTGEASSIVLPPTLIVRNSSVRG
ncbi:MAG TPA: GntR family transcriptional regulator [bacterium]|nr:GntR family transcriptional regulator [bacterium]